MGRRPKADLMARRNKNEYTVSSPGQRFTEASEERASKFSTAYYIIVKMPLLTTVQSVIMHTVGAAKFLCIMTSMHNELCHIL
jgi:hypothetical protein